MELSSGDSEQPRGRRDWAILFGLMAGYSLLFAWYYPPILGIEDEVGYMNQTLVWSKGAMTAEKAGYSSLIQFVPVGDAHVAVRQPGRSLLALPFYLAGGMKAVFWSGLLIHLATVWVGALVLKRLGSSPVWACLLLFHPTLSIYSRAIMADEGAGLGPLLAALPMAAGLRYAGFWSGAAVGLGALFRYHAGLSLPFAALSYRLNQAGRPETSPWRQSILCVVGGGLVGGLIVAYNLWLYHHPTDPNPSMRGSWSPSYVSEQIRFYVPALMLLWPGMLIAPLFDRSAIRWLSRLVCGFSLVTFLFYYWHDTGSSWFETAVLGLRLIQVTLPLWIVCYAATLDDRIVRPLRKALGNRPVNILACLGIAGLFLANGLVFAKHQGHLNNLVAAREAIKATVPDGTPIMTNGASGKLLGVPSDDAHYPLLDYKSGTATETPSAADWHLVIYTKSPEDTLLAESFARKHNLEIVATTHPNLKIFRTSRKQF